MILISSGKGICHFIFFSFVVFNHIVELNQFMLDAESKKKMLDALSQSLRGDELQSLLVCSDDDLTAQKIVSPLF